MSEPTWLDKTTSYPSRGPVKSFLAALEKKKKKKNLHKRDRRKGKETNTHMSGVFPQGKV